MAIKGMNAMYLRVGLDASDYNSGAVKIEKRTELLSKRVQKALGRVDLSTSVQANQGNVSGVLSNEAAMISAKIEALKSIKEKVSDATNGIDLSTPLSDQITNEFKALDGFSRESERLREKIQKASLKKDNSKILKSLQRDFSAINKASMETAGILNELQSAAAAIGSENIEFASVEGLADLDYSIKVLEADLKRLSETQQNTGQSAKNASHPIRSLGQWLRSIGSHIPGIRRTSDEVGRIGRRSRSSTIDIGRMVNGLRRVALVSFAFRVAGAAMGRLRSIVSEYISENSVLEAQVNGLKAGLGQSLAPAINLVTNAMSALMPYVLGVSNAIGQLMSLLFGSGWTAAADGAKKTAAATGGAAKAQKEMNRQLMSFDEINKMSADNDSSAGGGGGGGGSNIAPIESKTPAWLERFKTTFSELFASEEFQAANIGGKIGMSLQAGLDWLGSEGMRFDWRGVGTNLRENFDSFMGSGWVDSLFQTLGIYIGGFSDAVIGFLSPEWDELKRHYEENGAAGAVSYVIGFIGGLPGALAGAIYEHAFAPFFKGIGDYFREKGNDSVADFFDGISNGISGAGIWLKDNFGTVFLDDFASSLGLNFPLSPFTSSGRDMISQLLGGISGAYPKIQEKLAQLKNDIFSISDKIKDAFNFEWKVPSLRLPHLNVNWDPVDGVLARFFGVSAFPRLSVQWYAKGGILDGAQLFGRMGSTLLGGGEAGKEAVLPLERNTGWMDMIAQRVVSLLGTQNGGDINATIYLTLDGEILNRVVIKGLRKYARANGGSIL